MTVDIKKILHGLDSCGFHNGMPNICEITECPYRLDKVSCVHELAHDAGLLIRELLKPNCNTAYHDAAGCLGFCNGEDDEPIDVCKVCEKYTGNRNGGEEND